MHVCFTLDNEMKNGWTFWWFFLMKSWVQISSGLSRLVFLWRNLFTNWNHEMRQNENMKLHQNQVVFFDFAFKKNTKKWKQKINKFLHMLSKFAFKVQNSFCVFLKFSGVQALDAPDVTFVSRRSDISGTYVFAGGDCVDGVKVQRWYCFDIICLKLSV